MDNITLMEQVPENARRAAVMAAGAAWFGASLSCPELVDLRAGGCSSSRAGERALALRTAAEV
jgi:hypothetical protein